MILRLTTYNPPAGGTDATLPQTHTTMTTTLSNTDTARLVRLMRQAARAITANCTATRDWDTARRLTAMARRIERRWQHDKQTTVTNTNTGGQTNG